MRALANKEYLVGLQFDLPDVVGVLMMVMKTL